MSRWLPILRFKLLRLLARTLAPAILYRILFPIAALRALCKKNPAPLVLPEPIGSGTIPVGNFTSRWRYYQNATLGFFPDRLRNSEWLERCSFSGEGLLRECLHQGQPAILVCCHFGPVFLLSRWLQAAGFKSATLIGGKPETRSYLNRLKDRATLFPEIPRVMFADQLREVSTFLAAGNVLVIALDSPRGNQTEIQIDTSYWYRMATGPMRLAARHGAALFPCVILDDGQWRFRIVLGQPVPEELLRETYDFAAAGKHLLHELLPHFRAHPEQCSQMLLDCFQRSENGNKIETMEMSQSENAAMP